MSKHKNLNLNPCKYCAGLGIFEEGNEIKCKSCGRVVQKIKKENKEEKIENTKNQKRLF